MPITRSRFLRPRKKIRLVSVAPVTPDHPQYWPNVELVPTPTGPPGQPGASDRVASDPATVDARPTGLCSRTARRSRGRRPCRPCRRGQGRRTSSRLASSLGRARRRSRALALRDERVSQTTSGRRPPGTVQRERRWRPLLLADRKSSCRRHGKRPQSRTFHAPARVREADTETQKSSASAEGRGALLAA